MAEGLPSKEVETVIFHWGFSFPPQPVRVIPCKAIPRLTSVLFEWGLYPVKWPHSLGEEAVRIHRPKRMSFDASHAEANGY